MRLQIHPTRAVILLAAATVLSIVVATTFLLWDLRKRELEHARLETLGLARMLMEQTEQAFDGADLVLRGVQERLQTGYGSRFPLDSLPVHLLLNARISGVRQIAALFIVDAAGTVINSSRKHPIPPISVADREYYTVFADGRNTDRFVGKPVRNRIDGSWTLHVARPFVSPDRKFRGIVVAALSLEYFERLYNVMKLDFARPISLYMDDGTLVASLPHHESAIGEHAPELGPEMPPASGHEVQILAHTGTAGQRQVFALGHVEGLPLLVSVANDEEEALASWRETAVPIALGGGLMIMFIAVVATLLYRELRREQQLTRALREADDRFQGTIDSVMDAIVAVDYTQTILMFNPAAERMFGLAAAEAIGSPLGRLIPSRFLDGHGRHLAEFVASDIRSRIMAPRLEIVGQRANGTEFPIEATISQTLIGDKPQLTAVLRDVTDHRRAEAELREMNRQLRELSTALQSVREQERRRIARELHDELGQQLTGLKLDLTWLSRRLKEGRAAPPDKVDAMRRLLDVAIASVRGISSELRPLMLDDLGFGAAVTWQAEEFSRRSGIELALDLEAAERVKDDALATAFFRIVQESLTNIVRHAEATQVAIGLAVTAERLRLTICDNGKGMTADFAGGNGFGLVSMRERATALGGQFAIISSPGGGTTIEVTVPPSLLASEGEPA